MMWFNRLEMPEIIEITPLRLEDARGYFSEVYKRSMFEAEGIAVDWCQENQSMSVQAGTVRGLHFQAPPAGQDKLVRVLKGAVFDVAVDIRASSPSYGRWVGVTLSAAAGNQLFLPAGFAHGFLTIEPGSEVHYKVSHPYSPEYEGALRWNDPDVGIEWPDIGDQPVLSEKDEAAPLLSEFKSPFVFGTN